MYGVQVPKGSQVVERQPKWVLQTEVDPLEEQEALLTAGPTLQFQESTVLHAV